MRDEYVHHRLENWGRWKHGAGAGGLGYATVRHTDVVDCDREMEAVVPTSNVEAEVTDRAVMALASELRATVEVVYVLGGTMDAKARRLACTRQAIQQRLERADRSISRWLADQEATQKAQRARLEAIQEAARP